MNPKDKASTEIVTAAVTAPSELPDYILTEVFLENTGYFTPSSKRIKSIKLKEKVIGERVTPDGTKKALKVTISANATLGLPITSDLDYYRAFLKICDELVDKSGRFELPIQVPSKKLASLAGKPWGKPTRQEVGEWFDRMTGTLIKGGMYRAKHKDYDDGFSGVVFSQVIRRGDRMKSGKTAETNYVWPAPWWLSNYFYRYLKPVDFNFHRRLRKPIAKSLYSLLETGWYASGGKAYTKTYRDLAAEFLLTDHQYLAEIKRQLDPAHKELQHERFLKQWEYREAAGDSNSYTITYYPGEKFFEDQRARESRRQLAQRIAQKPPRLEVKKPQQVGALYLVHEIIRVTGDQHSTKYFTKIVRELSENTIWTLISETKQASLEGKIKTTAAQYFTDLAERALTKVREEKNQLEVFSS
ncbi:MAG: hypothetical protein D4R93_03425 [Deltaproteobacteria bacterium]|nr:MAG: hypothetical protein D4R93_03425 [Deltaproteobacteria bacterium]